MADDTRLEDAYLLLNYSNQNQTEAAQTNQSIQEQQPKKYLKLVAIHLGAGNGHNESQSLELAKSICEAVMLQSRESGPNIEKTSPRQVSSQSPNDLCSCGVDTSTGCSSKAEWAVVELVRKMEDHQMLNCGFGSNLNIHGQVECDASLMSDRTQMWAGVGALSGCKNPILLAKSLYDHRVMPRPLGLIQPNLLVASGAKQWMRKHCPSLSIVGSKMVSSKSFSLYQKLKSRHDAEVRLFNRSNIEQASLVNNQVPVGRTDKGSTSFEEAQSKPLTLHQYPNTSTSTEFDHGFYCMASANSSSKLVPPLRETIPTKSNSDDSLHYNEGFNSSNIKFQDAKLDTVGAVVVDSDNNFACAISSGGLLLKYKGRVGQAGVPGAGCWSEDSVAATATGVGEYLTLNLFARKFYDKMLTLRMLYDLGHVEKESDLSHLISCGVHECFRDFLRCPALAHVLPQERLAGLLSVCTLNSKECPKRIDENDLYLSYAHNTGSMCVGYMTSDDEVAHSIMSRYRADEKDSRACVKTIKVSLNTHKAVDSYLNNCPNQSAIVPL